MIQRTRAREHALQVLYYMDLSDVSAQEAAQMFVDHFEFKSEDQVYFSQLLEGIGKNRDDLDAQIEERLENWKFTRLGRIDRCLLRMGVFELIYHREIPQSVVINEAIELGKKYGDEKTSSFVNGILDKVAKHYSS